MNEPRSRLELRPLATLVAMAFLALLALPATGQGQNPSVDQYAPSTPSGGGDEPTLPDSGPSTDVGGDSSGDDDDSTGGGAAGGGSDPGDPEGAVPATTEPGDAVTSESAAGGDGSRGERDENTLESLAASGEQQREAAGSQSTGDSGSSATRLLRSDEGDDAGVGIFLWVVLGLTLAWAIAFGITRRRQDGHPA